MALWGDNKVIFGRLKLAILLRRCRNMSMSSTFPEVRLSAPKRCFSSPIIEDVIRRQAARIKDQEIAWLFGNCFPNTLDTTVDFGRDPDGKPDTFVITGDLNAMWLRDSTNQVWPYLPFIVEDQKLRDLAAGVMLRQLHCVRLDPYANAFLRDETEISEWTKTDQTEMLPGVYERKYELDSLCAVLRLIAGYYEQTRDITYFDTRFLQTIEIILETIEAQQEGTSYDPPYRFMRCSANAVDNLILRGHGQPANRCGLSKSPFRPSDDAAQLPFLVPANAMATVMLRRIVPILQLIEGGKETAAKAERLASEIDAAIRRDAIVRHCAYGDILAYEIDGYGSHYLMDDANVPSLLSLPYLGYLACDDPLYQRTRSFVLSAHNPYYFRGQAGRGVGGPHMGLGYIWPMAIIMQALTSHREEEVADCLSQLKLTHGGSGFMHESFWKDDASQFSRSWFAWANTLFGELILHVETTFPGLLAEREF